MTKKIDNSNQVKISSRLLKIASCIPQGCRMADIGSDHALLPVYLAQQGIIEYAIAGEVNEGPYQAAVRQVKQANIENLIDVRYDNGLHILSPGEVDTIVIAGMGGSTIVDILEQGIHHLSGVKRLVLQPNVGEGITRKWLQEQGWLLTNEHILEEDGLIYEILTFIPADSEPLKQLMSKLYEPIMLRQEYRVDPEWIILMGPYLIRHADEIFISKWVQEVSKREWIINHLSRSEQPESMDKRRKLVEEIKTIEVVLACLHISS